MYPVSHDLCLAKDVMMPVLDGLSATKTIIANCVANGHATPYIAALSAGVLPSDQSLCAEAGMSAFLAKPFTVAGIQEVCRSECLLAGGPASNE